MVFLNTILNSNNRNDSGGPGGNEEENQNAIHEFHNLLQNFIPHESLQNVEYGMWLTCKEDPLFSTSAITAKWLEIYRLATDIESYIAADLMRHLGLIEDYVNRMLLPEEFDSIAVLAACNEQIIISFSREKGIRFHFSEVSSFDYRIKFLDSYLNYCIAIGQLIERNNWEKDTGSESAGWWKSTIKATSMIEQNGPVEAVGKII